MSKKLRIGIVGIERGTSFAKSMRFFTDQAELVAICENRDIPQDHKIVKYLPENIKIYKDYDEFLKEGLDAVILCNYFCDHAKFAIKAFEAGAAVLSETTAAPSLGECVQLVEAYEKYKLPYMLAANCLYFRSVSTMKQKIMSGETGKVLYGEAEYLHGEFVSEAPPIDMNNLHWRQTLPPMMYNMHSLGPLMYVTESMPKTVSCTMHVDPDLARAQGKVTDCVGGITTTVMDNGAVFNATGCNSYPPTSKWFRIACSKMTMESTRYEESEETLTTAESAEGVTNALKLNAPIVKTWVPTLEEAGLIKEGFRKEDQEQTGHGGIDYFTTFNFLRVLQGKEEPFFNVYRAVALSAVAILGWYSALLDSKVLPIPDFSKKEERDKIRNDFRTPFAKRYEDLNMPCRLEDKAKFKL